MRRPRASLAVLLLAGCATTVAVPLPPTVRIVPPAPTLPREVAAFSGKWVGAWVPDRDVATGPRAGQRRDHILVVEEVTAAEATVIYALGTGAGLELTPDVRPVWFRTKGRFVGGALTLVFPAIGARASYRMRPDGTLDATQEREGRVFRARMARAPE